ncbi:hypothetical protein B0H67DRAFT_213195 [Lasiosphaeris hirsuta]|uniref:Uncharacterized protein n=1 Tax=Lasiosphaeris hirsuta TaxID=260670 RepID=A0AA40ASI2_9PEZI|nr:hypothetical protein B0H67DRAFT_213195 [Lasiosphaeris hirsuta]
MSRCVMQRKFCLACLPTLIVRDYGHMKPTMVYNCSYMAAICKNIENYLGGLPNTVGGVTFHSDKNKGRKRSSVSPSVRPAGLRRRGKPTATGDAQKKTDPNGEATQRPRPGSITRRARKGHFRSFSAGSQKNGTRQTFTSGWPV